MTRDEFFFRLAERPGDASAARGFDEALERELGATLAVLVTDLSGFTRLTQAYGVVHFLTLFRRFVELAVPCIDARGGRLHKMSADNLIALFADPSAALGAARDVFAAATRENEGQPEEGRIGLCCGVGYGSMLVLEDDCFGADVNLAYKLGEDVALPGEILVTEAAASRLPDDELDGSRSVKVGSVEIVHHLATR